MVVDIFNRSRKLEGLRRISYSIGRWAGRGAPIDCSLQNLIKSILCLFSLDVGRLEEAFLLEELPAQDTPPEALGQRDCIRQFDEGCCNDVTVGIPNFSRLSWSTTSHAVHPPQSPGAPMTRSGFNPASS